MKRALIGVIVVAVLVPTTAVVGREPPNLSGAWTYDPVHSDRTSRRWVAVPRPEGAVLPMDIDQAPEPSLGNNFTIRQDSKTVTFDLNLPRTIPPAGVVQYSAVYRMDGSESRNETPPALGRPAGVTFSTAAWNGSVLVVMVRSEWAERPTGSYSFRLDYDGRLIVDTTNLVEAPRTYTTAYTKKPSQ